MNMIGFSFRYSQLTLGLLIFFLLISPTLRASELRNWSDSTGTFSIEASFKTLKDGKVFLEKNDGTSIEIPLEKLSGKDHKYVKQQQSKSPSQNPFETPDSNPFLSTENPDALPPTPSPTTTETAKPSKSILENRVANANWQNATSVNMVVTGIWKPIPSQPPQASTIKKPCAFSIPPKNDFFEKITGTVINPQCGLAVICYQNEGNHGQPCHSRLAICDLNKKGRIVNQSSVPGEFALLDVDDSGTIALMRQDEFGFGKSSRAEIWSISKKGIVRGMQWHPFAKHDTQNQNHFGGGFNARGFQSPGFNNQRRSTMRHGNERIDDIEWARFIGNNQALILSEKNLLTAWDLSRCKVLWHANIGTSHPPTLSQDRRYLAFCNHKIIGILDTQNGELIASTFIPPKLSGSNTRLAFSPSMKRLAVSSGNYLSIWDLGSGKLLREMEYVGSRHFGGSVAWTNEGYVLVGGSCLIDAANCIQLWAFEGGTGIVTAGYVWFRCGGEKSMGFIPVKLPHPEMLSKLKQAMQDPNFFILQPGTIVKLDVSGVKTNQEEVLNILTKKLQKHGFKVGSNGTISLIANQKLGKREKYGYSRHFGFHSDMEFEVQDYISELRFVYKEKAVWARSKSSVPHNLRVGKNETYKQKIRETEKFTNELFKKTSLPAKLMKTSGSTTFGKSRVTPHGIM